MKKLILLVSLLFVAQSFANEFREIQSLENQGQNLEAMIAALEAHAKLEKSLQFDRLVSEVQTVSEKVSKEVVTETARTNRSSGGISFKIDSMGIPGIMWGHSSSSTRQDVARWTVANPEEVARRDAREAADLSRLRENIRNYFSANKEKLWNLKVLATKALQLSSKISDADLVEWVPVLEKVYATSVYFEFSGRQSKLECETKYHAATLSEQSQRMSFGLLYLLGAGFISENSGKRVEGKAYKEKSCVASAETATLTSEEVLQIQFVQLDQNLKAWYRQFSIRSLKVTQPPEFFSWGSPYYR